MRNDKGGTSSWPKSQTSGRDDENCGEAEEQPPHPDLLEIAENSQDVVGLPPAARLRDKSAAVLREGFDRRQQHAERRQAGAGGATS